MPDIHIISCNNHSMAERLVGLLHFEILVNRISVRLNSVNVSILWRKNIFLRCNLKKDYKTKA